MSTLAFESEARRQRGARGGKVTQQWPGATRSDGFMIVEMLAVVVMAMGLLVMAWVYLSNMRRPRCGCSNSCINNLKQIGTAYRIWANDNGDLFPAFAAVTNGGWKELAAGPNAGALCWTNYTIMQNEMGQSAKVVVCPSDEREATTNFNAGTFNNLNLSYFVGADVNDNRPEAILGGDRNLTNFSAGAKPAKNWGFSPSSGRGNDVLVNGPLAWTKALHSKDNVAGSGNILLGDGSVQQVTSARFTKDFLQPALDAAEARAGATRSVGIRLIFP